MEGLCQVVVGACLQACYKVLLRIAGSQQEDVRINWLAHEADAATQFDSVDSRHHPVQKQQLGRVVCLHHFKCLKAVIDRNDFISPLSKTEFEDPPRDRVEIGRHTSELQS